MERNSEGARKLGRRIRSARAMNGLSQRDLAPKIGVSHTAIAYWEQGRIVPGSYRLLAVAEACGVKFEYFFRPISITLERVRFCNHEEARDE